MIQSQYPGSIPGSDKEFGILQVENFGMEVKDFEGAVKMQGAMMDKLASSRLPILISCFIWRGVGKKKTIKKLLSLLFISVLFLKITSWRERGKREEDDRNTTRNA